MADLNYNGQVVNLAVSNASGTCGEFVNLENELRDATNKIVSAKGFNEYVGGISSDSFSSSVGACRSTLESTINYTKNLQAQVLAYSGDEEEIKDFINILDRSDFDRLDLSCLEDYMPENQDTVNAKNGVLSTLVLAHNSLQEGVWKFAETGADLIIVTNAKMYSPLLKATDLIFNTTFDDKLWRDTQAIVAKDYVGSVFDSYYSDGSVGQRIKDNAYAFGDVRGVGNGIGYTIGNVALNTLTLGAAGISSLGMAGVSGTMGYSRALQNAWGDGATVEAGERYALVSGTYDAIQWYLGGQTSQLGILSQNSNSIFASSGDAVMRVGLDTLNGTTSSFVQPGLTLIYKDYGGENLLDNYNRAFVSFGGLDNTRRVALMSLFLSSGGEALGARKLLMQNKKGSAIDVLDQETVSKANELFESENLVPSDKVSWTEELSQYYDPSRPVDEQVIERFTGKMDGSYSGQDALLMKLRPDDFIESESGKHAKELFKGSFLESYKSGNEDALVFMHDISEDGLFKLETGAKTSNFDTINKAISLDEDTLNADSSSTVFHENTHRVFDKTFGKEAPEYLAEAQAEAAQNIVTNNRKEVISFLDEVKSKRVMCQEEVDTIVNNRLSELNMTEDDYILEKAQQFEADRSARMDRLRECGVSEEAIAKMTSTPATEIAKTDFDNLKMKMSERLFESRYSGYKSTSAMIEEIDGAKGGFDYVYGHGRDYFLTDPIRATHEQVANYGSLRLDGPNGDTECIEILEKLAGEKYVKSMEKVYQEMLHKMVSK